RGKFLWWRLADPDGADTGEALMGHLGMSGQLRLTTPEGTAVTPGVPPALSVPSEGPASDPLRHRRLSLHLDDGARVDLVDQRLFGGLWASPLVEAADGALAGLAALTPCCRRAPPTSPATSSIPPRTCPPSRAPCAPGAARSRPCC